ncbi:MAG: DUF4230 domain-containing protein [Bacteroidota bacterium]|jgi:hypothetical protein
MKGSLTFPLLLIAFLCGIFVSWNYFQPRKRSVEDASVILEKIEAVKKLITVEGHFSEIYNYSEYQGYFTFFWDKKILVRVRATVAAGYDLNALKVEADPLTKTVYMSALSEPQILSIDHTLDYYDISEGIFESFSSEDYNRINQRAKDIIRDQATKSNLLNEARNQGNQMVELIRFMVESAGWRLQTGEKGVSEKPKVAN